MVITGSESPIVVVLSGSMEPAFARGDLLGLTLNIPEPHETAAVDNREKSIIPAGEIIVFSLSGKQIPIVHRVISVHEKPDGTFDLLTKVLDWPVARRPLVT